MSNQSFGAWLLAQANRKDAVGTLAKIAKTDSAFPHSGNPEQVFGRLNATGADPEMFEAVEDAEVEWRASGDA